MPDRAPGRTARFTVALRHSLRGEHERVEHRLGLPASISGHADYSRLLSLWSTVWESVEAAVSPATAPGSELTILAGHALAALAVDRDELERRQPHESCHQPPVPSFDSPVDEASLWGAAYVLRGSALGNQYLHPLILTRLGGGSPVSLHYLSGSGPDVRREWSAFCRRLDHWAARTAQPDQDRATAAAANMFRFVGAVADATGWSRPE